MKVLLINLFKTFIFAIIIAIAINAIHYSTSGSDSYTKAINKIASGTFILDLILLIMSLPVLFLNNITFWNNIVLRVILYFSGTLIFLIAVATLPVTANSFLYYCTGTVYLIVQVAVYFTAAAKIHNR